MITLDTDIIDSTSPESWRKFKYFAEFSINSVLDFVPLAEHRIAAYEWCYGAFVESDWDFVGLDIFI